jgi:MGT family glycosyltransferase
MARFLLCPVPAAGDVYPSVPVALALRARGHEVAYLTNEEFSGDLRNEGIHCFLAPGGVWASETPERPDSGSASFAYLRAQLGILSRAFDELQGDVLVDGAFPFAPRLFAELHGIPHASIHAGCFPIPTGDALFPYGHGQPPPTDEHGRLLARMAAIVQQEREREELVAWDAARVSLGLPPCGAHPVRSASSPYLVLLASPPAFEYPRSDLPAQYWFTGPLVWQSRLAPMPESIARLTDREPIVYVSQGASYNRNPVILKLAFEALASEPVQVVATTVRSFDPAEFAPLPANVILEQFVPFSQLVDRLSLVITHGGAGAVHAALSAGVPTIVLPFTVDQPEVAARCAWTGAGIRLDPWTCTPAELRAAVRAILSDPGYRTNARRIMESGARLEGLALAGRLLERLAETRQPVARPEQTANPWAGEYHA